MIKTLLDLSVFQQVTFFRYKVKYAVTIQNWRID